MPDGPILILGLQRGGTNQLLNILRSHPDTVWPNGEFHEVLRPKRNSSASLSELLRLSSRYLPVLLRKGDVLSPHRPPKDGAADHDVRQWIADELHKATARNRPEVDRYRAAMAEQDFPNRKPAPNPRMVVKLVNYNVGLARDLQRIYLDARFVGIMREPVGVCESMISRGMPSKRVLSLYQYVARMLVELRDSGFPIVLTKFEDIISDIVGISRQVYEFCGLDPDGVSGLCLQDKTRVLDDSGRIIDTKKVDAFYDINSASGHLRKDVNASARSRIPADLRRQIEESCGPLSEQLGYAPARTATASL